MRTQFDSGPALRLNSLWNEPQPYDANLEGKMDTSASWKMQYRWGGEILHSVNILKLTDCNRNFLLAGAQAVRNSR